MPERVWPGRLARREWRMWLAAIIDAEGAITISRQPIRETGQAYYTLTIAVKNTSLALLEQIQAVAGLGNIREISPINPRAKPAWIWRAHGPSAATVLEAIRRHLIVKPEQAKVALSLQATKRGRGGWHRPNGIFETQAQLYKSLRGLNMRGKQTTEDTTPPIAETGG